MTVECCGPILEKVLALGSKGLRSIDLYENRSLSSDGKTLAQIIEAENFCVQTCRIDGLCVHSLDAPDIGDEFYETENSQMLKAALERNERLERETHEAALGILSLGRIVLLGAAGPSRSSYRLRLRSSTGRFRLLDLPSELLQLVLSFIFPGALSDRQLLSVVRHAADRTTLLPTTLEMETLGRQAEAWSDLSFEAEIEFLMKTGCHSYE